MRKIIYFVIFILINSFYIQAKSGYPEKKLGPMGIRGIRYEYAPLIEVEANSDSNDFDNVIAKHIKETVKYNQVALECGIQGEVVVTFTITKEGKVTNEKVIREVHDRLTKEVLIAVKELDEWLPTQNFSIKEDREITISTLFTYKEVIIDKNGVNIVVDKRAQVSINDFYTDLHKKLKYPKKAKKEKIEGISKVEFVVEEDGSIGEATIMKGYSLSPELDQEAIRLVKESKGWIPAEYQGKNVRSYEQMYILFELKKTKHK